MRRVLVSTCLFAAACMAQVKGESPDGGGEDAGSCARIRCGDGRECRDGRCIPIEGSDSGAPGLDAGETDAANPDRCADPARECEARQAEDCVSACGTAGTRSCSAQCTWGECVAEEEECNGADDDCDGDADEDFECVQREVAACETDCGSEGTRTCDPRCSLGECVAPAEVCNGLDDDCDGVVDDGFPLTITSSFAADSDEWRLNGNAYRNAASGWIVLTDAVDGQTGSLILARPLLANAFVASFSVWIGGGDGADGLVFGVFDVDGPEALGGGGGGMGAFGLAGYGVELDTYENPDVDPNANHVSLYDTGATDELATAADVPPLRCSCWLPVRVELDLGRFIVTVDGEQVLDAAVPDFEPYEAYLGFTAATGGANDVHAIDDVTITFDDQGCR
ncbi:MAG: hypothetical protein HYY06_29145 [Deltaproteobacteria bacterium]|nr:hypothetical protein [Deltaproteobacteria bacterium]